MDTPDKNRISAVSLCNVEDSPVFQYINDLSPIEPVKGARAENIFHSLASSSPTSLFSSPQINSYRDSRFSIKRHRSLELSSPVVLIGESVKSSPDVLEAVPFKEQISLAIELANTLKNGNDGCDIQMVSCDEVTMDAENDIRRAGSRKQSDDLCRELYELEADSDGVLVQTEEMEAEIGSGARKIMVDVAGIQNRNVVEPGGSYSVQVPAKAPDISLRSLFNVAAIDSTSKAEDMEEIGLQPSHKQRSVRRRCLSFEVGGSYNRIPLRDSTNDLPLGFTSINKAPYPQKCLDSIKQVTDEILPIPQSIGLHLNSLVNSSASSDRNNLIYKEGAFSTPVSTKRDLVSYDNDVMEVAPERSMEGAYFEELGNCKRCRCRKSKCLKLYCDCFAAGLYCVEPCSCQNCFNKPIHEDTVMKSRREIEDRNPLAFAPKLASTSDYATSFANENIKTPASARHTRGCNCKKSGCLKKYCECFLMGVGCSPSCRCVGCKNIVGDTNVDSVAVTINEEAKDHGNYL
ncbi:hypothetical protein AALP_AA3G043300 [Arabis alpina]|uniref:CRC domain-containing protein n=1 Tax=Arabis alpina TaxID=50452 RepID=A0A087H6Z5_ARAAL|nr:hypothetical protein AALP_AA3G043300 [Arabis alpina]